MPSKLKSSLRNASRFRRGSMRKTFSLGVTAPQCQASLLDPRQQMAAEMGRGRCDGEREKTWVCVCDGRALRASRCR